jgi:hypothetical protein
MLDVRPLPRPLTPRLRRNLQVVPITIKSDFDSEAAKLGISESQRYYLRKVRKLPAKRMAIRFQFMVKEDDVERLIGLGGV